MKSSNSNAVLASSSPFAGRVVWLITLPVLVALFLLQSEYMAQGVLHHDVASHFHFSQLMLQGKKAYVDFVDMNAPLIWYAGMIPAAMSAGCGMSEYNAIVLCMYVLICSMLLLTLYGLRRLWSANSGTMALSAVVLLFVCLIVPRRNFAQREHLTVLMLLPWFLALLESYQPHQQRRALWWQILSGVCAGLAMSIKPMFVLPVAFVLCIVVWRVWLKKQKGSEGLARRRMLWYSLSTPSIMVALLTWLLCTVLLLLLHPQYPDVLLFAMKAYQATVPTSLYLENKILPLLAFMALLLYATRNKRAAPIRAVESSCTAYSSGAMLYELSIILLAAALAFFAVYILQQKGYDYHRLPAKMIATLAGFTLIAYLWQGYASRFPRLLGGGAKGEYRAYALSLSVCLGFSLFYSKKEYKADFGNAKTEYAHLSQLIREHTKPQNRRVANLSTRVDGLFPPLLDTQAELITPANCLWMLSKWYGDTTALSSPQGKGRKLLWHSKEEMPPDEYEWFQKIIAPHLSNPPALIFSTPDPRNYVGTPGFDIIDYYCMDEEFARLFLRYVKIYEDESYTVYSMMNDER